jgi:hypothetical protein
VPVSSGLVALANRFMPTWQARSSRVPKQAPQSRALGGRADYRFYFHAPRKVGL